MPPNSEIEKLERRWKENPKGTVFAPYAEVLRKHGDHLLARDVLRQGLELHPDHIPGNIVLGRCCLDLREDGPAEAAFNHVLDLDQENVIALKALADITERQGRLMEAADWLSRLISVDPSNDEARDQLARVDAAREAAAAAMTAPLTQEAGQAPAPTRAEDVTEALPLVARHAPPPPPPPLPEVPTVEVATGQVSEDADAQLDARFSLFDESPAKTVPIGLPSLPPYEAPPPAAPPAPVMEILEAIEPAALELVEPEMVAEPMDAVAPTSAAPETSLDEIDVGEVYSIGHEEPASIDLRPSSATEFQTPDDSAALLELAPTGSEFQVPDASSELKLSSAGGTEYQTPSGADELLRASERQREPEPVLEPEPAPEPEPLPGLEPAISFDEVPRPYSKVITTGFAAIELMPTQELPTEPTDEPLEMLEPEPEPESVQVPILSVEPEAAVAAEAEPEPEFEPEADESSLVDMLAAAGTATVVSESGSESEPIEPTEPAAPESNLKLIFPDDVSEPEPPRHRRITEEMAAVAEPVTPEPAVPEPAPVLTESMADLYLRQGHLAEAMNVYRELAARQPDDQRLQQKVRDLQAALAAGSRRHSYVAMDTGGESVESFFRSLADARPAGSAASRPMVEDEQGGGAPTRPANDPLSLSAIFGEEAASTSSASAVGETPAKPQAPDAFSFDQFFGAASSGGANSAQGGRPSGGEDLDQFQHWLKSLKK